MSNPNKQFLKQRAKAVQGTLRLSIGLQFASGLLLIVQAWVLAKVVSAVLVDHKSLSDLWNWILLLPVLFTGRSILAWIAERVSFEAAARTKQSVRSELLERMGRLGPVRLAGEGGGDLVTTLQDGVEGLESYYSRYLPAMTMVVLLPLAILVVVFPNDLVSGIVMTVTAPLIPVFMMLIGMGTEKLNQSQWRKLARLSAHFLDMIRGLTTLKLFGASAREAKAIGKMSEDYRASTMKVLRVAFLSSLVLEFFATISIAIIAVLIGFRLLAGEMAFVQGFFVLLLAPDFYLPLRNMGTHYHARMEAIGAAERMVDLFAMELPEEGTASLQADLATTLIEFDAVTVSYDGESNALDGASFTLRPGEHAALVGPSGSGKSTIMSLLLGFITPQGGTIRIAGQSLGDLSLSEWRKQLAYVPQSPVLFAGSIADNIRLARPDASLQEVQQAARTAFADEFIDDLPNGYDTLVGERGAGLSGGQIQRVAIARAILQDAALILLDEPTANLDTQAEAKVREALRSLAQGRTVLTIAHRLGTARQADRLLVCDKGKIVAQGSSHDELITTSALYAELTGEVA